tara:strand:+ start:771 stop:1109 length:339 start_codon:yes stop_codon:yes gene_type:complete
MSVTTTNTLYLIKGSENTVSINLLDENDASETLTGFTASKVGIGKTVGDTSILSKTSSLSISGNTVTFALSSSEAAALQTGQYVGFVKLTKDVGGAIFYTEPFRVSVSAKPE